MRAGRDRRIRTSASGSQRPLPCAAWLCLRVAAPILWRGRRHHGFFLLISVLWSMLSFTYPNPIMGRLHPRLLALRTWRIVPCWECGAADTPTAQRSRFNLHFACHHYLQRGNFGGAGLESNQRSRASTLCTTTMLPLHITAGLSHYRRAPFLRAPDRG